MSSKYDVVIVGAGPMGLMLAVCLSRWGHRVKVIDNRETTTPAGRADGLAARTTHILANLGLTGPMMERDHTMIYQNTFWDPAHDGSGIRRTSRKSASPNTVQARYPYNLILPQGEIEKVLIEDLRKHDCDVQRPWTITAFRNNEHEHDFPMDIELQAVGSSEIEHVQSNYLCSAEGSKSWIRNQLGVRVSYKDDAAYVWGVIDGRVRSDFPDIKIKSNIHSKYGSVMIIPREREMVRFYVQMASSSDDNFDYHQRFTAEEVQSKAKRILSPFQVEWTSLDWYSVYPIRQGIAEKFSVNDRIFMGGDCCHTHSPKAGQGMNTAFHDALNLSWKIHLVEAGFADASLLGTYESERKDVAEKLLEFDARYSALFSRIAPAKPASDASQSHTSGSSEPGKQENEEDEFQKVFKASQAFTSGHGIFYPSSKLVWSSHKSTAYNNSLVLYPSETLPNASSMAPNISTTKATTNGTNNSDANVGQTTIVPGCMLPRANVTRVIDAHAVELEQVFPLSGAFRIFIFAGRPSSNNQALYDLATALQRSTTFHAKFATRDGSKSNSTSDGNGETHTALAARTESLPTPPSSSLSSSSTTSSQFADLFPYPSSTTTPSQETSKHNPESTLYTYALIFAAPWTEIDHTDSSMIPPLFMKYRYHIYADDLHADPINYPPFEDHVPGTIDAYTAAIVAAAAERSGHAVAESEGVGVVHRKMGFFLKNHRDSEHQLDNTVLSNGKTNAPTSPPTPERNTRNHHHDHQAEGEQGAVVIVRPDGHVGCVIRLTSGPATADTMDEYFAGFLKKTNKEQQSSLVLSSLA